MAGYFIDTSALAKLYRQELGSDFMDGLFATASAQLLISRLAIVELESVFALKIRTGELDEHAVSIARRRLGADLGRRRIMVASVSDHHFMSARNLLMKYGARDSLRTLDALQLSVAIALRDGGLAAVFVAADHRLCRVAAMEGFPVTNPEQPSSIVI